MKQKGGLEVQGKVVNGMTALNKTQMKVQH